MKLHVVSDGPPSTACKMVLKALNIPCELVDVNYNAGEHLTDEYAKVSKSKIIIIQVQNTIEIQLFLFQLNPQREIPVLDDNGFVLGESIAIMQYLCDQYAPETPLYPTDPKKRALVNHRLLFNMGFYYNYISQYAVNMISFSKMLISFKYFFFFF